MQVSSKVTRYNGETLCRGRCGALSWGPRVSPRPAAPGRLPSFSPVQPCQGWGRGFESLRPLQNIQFSITSPPMAQGASLFFGFGSTSEAQRFRFCRLGHRAAQGSVQYQQFDEVLCALHAAGLFRSRPRSNIAKDLWRHQAVKELTRRCILRLYPSKDCDS